MFYQAQWLKRPRIVMDNQKSIPINVRDRIKMIIARRIGAVAFAGHASGGTWRKLTLLRTPEPIIHAPRNSSSEPMHRPEEKVLAWYCIGINPKTISNGSLAVSQAHVAPRDTAPRDNPAAAKQPLFFFN
ncbi:hypothetical protein CRG98_047061 [Punica granatum]|uniref:Uncharacterized protein n=1 Tax=Punica granatum TaxID=22663 RepID=A0A2I0HLI0_PUNGR|nr:hypothetical protein CRG98_047061 [Punica granatum]